MLSKYGVEIPQQLWDAVQWKGHLERADNIRVVAPGMWRITTPYHGYTIVTPEQNLKIPELFRQHNQHYEEDCDAPIPNHFILGEDLWERLLPWYPKEIEIWARTNTVPEHILDQVPEWLEKHAWLYRDPDRAKLLTT